VVGLKTNIEFLKQLVAHPSFIEGDVETGFISVTNGQLLTLRNIISPYF
jgi:3-methylcrotonyl-CoA carboxylase alpha subunit